MSVPLSEGQRDGFPDEGITWAGECPWTGNYCFGTESGEVLFCNDTGHGPFIALSEVLAEEAINGVAFWKDFIGVSTRSEVNLHRFHPGDGSFELIAAGKEGAFGISATPRGQFVAPMGTTGLFCINAKHTPQPQQWIEHASEATLNYYALSYLGSSGEEDIFACAARTDGLLTIQFHADETRNRIVRLTSPKVDLIDVCPLRSPAWPFAAAALSLDCSLIFIRNALSEGQPQTLRFKEFCGAPYSILSAEGHLIVLTSKEIVILPYLVSRYLNEEKLDSPIHYRHTPIQAVDAYIAYGKDLMVIVDEGVKMFEIDKLIQPTIEHAQVSKSTLSSSWDERDGVPQLISTPWEKLVA